MSKHKIATKFKFLHSPGRRHNQRMLASTENCAAVSDSNFARCRGYPKAIHKPDIFAFASRCAHCRTWVDFVQRLQGYGRRTTEYRQNEGQAPQKALKTNQAALHAPSQIQDANMGMFSARKIMLVCERQTQAFPHSPGSA